MFIKPNYPIYFERVAASREKKLKIIWKLIYSRNLIDQIINWINWPETYQFVCLTITR